MKYGTDTPIFVSEVSVPNMSQNAVRQYFMRLCKDGKLKRYDTGVYYIPTKTAFGTDSTLSRNQVIQKKYLETKDGEVCGFYTGMQLLNSVGLTTQVPAIYEISTNVAMEGDVRSRSNCEIKPLESSARSASSSWVRLFCTRSSFIFAPIFKFPASSLTGKLKLNLKFSISKQFYYTQPTSCVNRKLKFFPFFCKK